MIDWTELQSPDLFYAPEPWDAAGVLYSKGWFFCNESYDIYGPYVTEETALEETALLSTKVG